MDIITLSFEETFILEVNGQLVKLIAYRMPETGLVKFGVEAPRDINIHREEIYQAILLKEAQSDSTI